MSAPSFIHHPLSHLLQIIASVREPQLPHLEIDDAWFKSVEWTDASQLADHFSRWNSSPLNPPRARSLIFSITEVPSYPPVPIVALDGVTSHIASTVVAEFVEKILHLNGRNTLSFVSPPLHLKMRCLAASFINLETLVFRSTAIHPSWHTVIHELVHLRTLQFDSCIVPEAVVPINHTNLTIAKLCLRNVTRCSQYHNQTSSLPTYPNALDTLASSGSITTLHLDVTSLAMIPFSDSPSKLPVNIHNLNIHPRQGNPSLNPIEMILAEVHLVYILDLCPHVDSFYMQDLNFSLVGHFFERSGLKRYGCTYLTFRSISFPFHHALQELELLDLDLTAPMALSIVRDFVNIAALKLCLQLRNTPAIVEIFTYLQQLKRLSRLCLVAEVCFISLKMCSFLRNQGGFREHSQSRFPIFALQVTARAPDIQHMSSDMGAS
jgi:hypothetical protein